MGRDGMTLSMQWVTAAVGVSSVAPAEKSILLQGLLLRAGARPSRGLMIFLRPASIWQLMPIEQTSAANGIDLLCATTRFARNEALATFEETLLDLGAWIRVAKGEWNYRYVVLLGWS